MPNASTLENMSPRLLKVAERAKREPEGRFHSLAHLIDVPALTRAYERMRKDAAVGVDLAELFHDAGRTYLQISERINETCLSQQSLQD